MSLFFRQPVEQRGSSDSFVDFGHGGPIRHDGKATHLAPVFSSIRHITDYVSTLPVVVYRGTDSNRKKAPTLPPLLASLEDAYYEYGIGPWLSQAAYGLVVHGNAVGLITKRDGTKPTAVTWLRDYEWFCDESTPGFPRWYVNGALTPRQDIVHIPWIVPSGYTLGMSPIEHYAASIGAGLSAQEYADMKRGGGLPPSTLKNTTQVVDPEAAKTIGARLAKRFAAGEPFVFGKDWEFGTVSIPPNHAQFIETMKMTTDQIAGLYGLDPADIGGQPAHSMTYATEETRLIKRAANVRPYLVRIEKAVSRLLLGNLHMEFDVDATLRVDAKTRTDIQTAKVAAGLLTRNEARKDDDLPPIKGGDDINIGTPVAPQEQPGQPNPATPKESQSGN